MLYLLVSNFLVIIVSQNFKGWVSGFEVEVVDTTGAGESFVSGMLCIMAAHKDIYKVMQLVILHIHLYMQKIWRHIIITTSDYQFLPNKFYFLHLASLIS